jgi:hypothetical protein
MASFVHFCLCLSSLPLLLFSYSTFAAELVACFDTGSRSLLAHWVWAWFWTEMRILGELVRSVLNFTVVCGVIAPSCPPFLRLKHPNEVKDPTVSFPMWLGFAVVAWD